MSGQALGDDARDVYRAGADCRGESRERRMRETNPISAAEFIPPNGELFRCSAKPFVTAGAASYMSMRRSRSLDMVRRCRVGPGGEQPGDQEDRDGIAVRRTRRAIPGSRAWGKSDWTAAQLYMTRRGRHFRFEERGKRESTRQQAGDRLQRASPGSTLNWL